MSDWTSQEWMEWYDDELAGDSAWMRATADRELDVSQLPQNLPEDIAELKEVAKAISAHQHNFLASLLGHNVRETRAAFEHLSPEFKQRIYAWHARWSSVLPDSESIISELGEIVIGVPGSEGREPEAAEEQVDEIEVVDPNEVVSTPVEAPPVPADDVEEPVEWPEGPETVKIGLPNDNFAFVAGEVDQDPAVYIDGVETAEEAERRRVDAMMASMPPELDNEPTAAGAPGCLRPIMKLATGVVGLIVLVGGVVLATRGDDDPPAETSAPTIDENSEFTDSSGDIDEVETFRDDDPDIENDPGAECAVVEDHEMAFLSPDAPDGFMGDEWFRTSLRERGWPSPSFEWSGVPDEATELAIVITTITPDKRIEVESDPDSDFRVGSPLFILTDIDPSVTSLDSALGGAKIEGATLRDHGAANVELDGGVLVSDVYLGLDSTGEMLFTLLAMCNPPDNNWEPAALPWMGGSIAHDSFVVYMG